MKTLIIDNFLPDPNSVRQFGLGLSYRRRNNDEYWEGQRSEKVSLYDKNLEDKICRNIIKSYFNINNFILIFVWYFWIKIEFFP